MVEEAKGRGIGGRLHEDLPFPTAALSTVRGETPVMQLYRKRGWVTLLDHHRFPNSTEPMRIMGLDLQAFQQAR